MLLRMLELSSVILFVFCLLSLFLWFYFHYNYFFKLKNILGPAPVPLIGNALYFREINDILPNLMRFKKKYGSPFKLSFGFQYPRVIICDPKFMTFFLSSTKYITKSEDYKFLRNWLGNGLLTSTGKEWKGHRKMITPAFHFNILEQFLDVFEKNVDIMINKWEREVGTKCFDVFPYLKLFTLDIICETALRTEINAQIDDNSDYVRAVQTVTRIMMERSLSLFVSYESIYKFTNKFVEERDALKIINDLTDSVVKRRKEEIENQSNYQTEEFKVKRKLAFLDLLLQAEADGERLSEISIREEVNTFMFEGHDTTASAISFCLFNISQHPKVQKKIVEELKTISEKSSTDHYTYSDLQEMKYLEAVIKETLRLYPSVPIFGRLAIEDIVHDGKVIPKGSTISLFAFGLLRDPELFPEPEKFLPERFLNNNVKINNPYSYVPFSAGPRNCIGQKFAMLEMKSTIGHILRKFELHPADENFRLNLIVEAILKSTTGIKIGIKKRG
ncbi:cytochrome P450 4d2-like [Agrilus planipennis]|uniref:Cytochrome P450 4d2-like n=1 Tax=Agrilus planipennis TaxID=224129 RepID=A0A1W4W6L8_AGRPL|nr:cytochrome P450 4d2-like [Agrilus planipennis]